MLAIAGAAASAAQAGEWQVEGRSFAEMGITKESTSATGSGLVVSGKILGQAFSMTCATQGIGNAYQGGGGEDTLTLSGCAVSQPASCTVAGPITTTPLTSEQVTIAGAAYERISAANGGTLATVPVSKCAIAGKYPLNGSFVAKAELAGTELKAQPLSFSAANNEAGGVNLTLGPNPATATGKVNVSLTGANSGKTWSRKGLSEGESEAETLPSEWRIGRSSLKTRGLSNESISISGGSFNIEWVNLGQEFKVGCSSLSSSNGTIAQGAVGNTVLKFSGCAFSKPATCTVSSEIQTTMLKSSFVYAGGKDFEQFAPAEGSSVATLEIGGCSWAGKYVVSGKLGGRAERYGLESVTHGLAFSPAVSSEAGTFLTMGPAAVNLTGNAGQSLAGAFTGWVWGAR